MENLRVVRFEDPLAFLDATKEFDDSFMNFCIGSVYDYLAAPKTPELASSGIYIFAVYRAVDLLITLTKNTQDLAWMMSTPSTAQPLLANAESAPYTRGLLIPATTLLAEFTLAHLPHPSALSKLMGPESLTTVFLTTWSSLLLRSLGKRVRITPDALTTRVSYATRHTLPPLPLPHSQPSSHIITRASPADIPALALLYADFLFHGPFATALTPFAAAARLAHPVAAHLVWLSRSPNDVHAAPSGYVLLGRVTPRTIAIRNVYVAPAHRRAGIAGAMVHAVTRHYLGVPPYGIDGVPDIGVKQEVCLHVGDEGAERLYKRAGFLLPDTDITTDGERTGGLDPVTGRSGWYPSTWRDVGFEEPASTEAQV